MGVPIVAQWLVNPTRNYEVAGSIPGVAVSCGVGRSYSSDSTPAWEPPHAAKKTKKQNTKTNNKKSICKCSEVYNDN